MTVRSDNLIWNEKKQRWEDKEQLEKELIGAETPFDKLYKTKRW